MRSDSLYYAWLVAADTNTDHFDTPVNLWLSTNHFATLGSLYLSLLFGQKSTPVKRSTPPHGNHCTLCGNNSRGDHTGNIYLPDCIERYPRGELFFEVRDKGMNLQDNLDVSETGIPRLPSELPTILRSDLTSHCRWYRESFARRGQNSTIRVLTQRDLIGINRSSHDKRLRTSVDLDYVSSELGCKAKRYTQKNMLNHAQLSEVELQRTRHRKTSYYLYPDVCGHPPLCVRPFIHLRKSTYIFRVGRKRTTRS